MYAVLLLRVIFRLILNKLGKLRGLKINAFVILFRVSLYIGSLLGDAYIPRKAF